MVKIILFTTLIKKEIEVVNVLKTDSKWFGVTYIEDKPFVKTQIKNLLEKDEYPKKLFFHFFEFWCF